MRHLPPGGVRFDMADSYTLYGLDFSLFTGKTRSYLRKKGIPFEEVGVRWGKIRSFIIERTGVKYVPVVKTPDDKVIQDTTVIIDELEKRFPEHSVYPDTPKQKLVSLLLELYADEWLFIPAMHYRWYYEEENYRYLYDKFGAIAWKNAPGPLRRWIGKKVGAEFRAMVPGLGVTDANYRSIEVSYENFLNELNAHLEIHDYVLGSKPCIADFGFMAPLYAHLYLDPAPGKLMRELAPAVVQWIKRMNDNDTALQKGAFLDDDQIPETLLPILKRMAMEQVPTLLDVDQRLTAWRAENPDAKEIDRYIGWHSFVVEGVSGTRRAQTYPNWMFQRSIDFYRSLKDTADVDHLLDQVGMGRALRVSLKNRLVRRKNLLQFAD